MQSKNLLCEELDFCGSTVSISACADASLATVSYDIQEMPLEKRVYSEAQSLSSWEFARVLIEGNEPPCQFGHLSLPANINLNRGFIYFILQKGVLHVLML